MAISNTSILIKRSLTTGKPTSLNAGEFAYSYASNTLFIGTPGGTGVVNVGGQYYTSTLDAATSANTASTLVKRDAVGGFSGQLYGNATTASTLQNAQNFSISGGDITATTQSFNGSSAVVLNASLNTISGLSAGTYGSTTSIPVVTVAANGRVTSISTAGLSTSITVSGNTGSGTYYTGNTLGINGASGGGITTTATGSGSANVFIGVDTTVVRANLATSPQYINSDLTINGNVTITGTQSTFNVSTTTVQVGDSLIELASNNIVGDIVDIGFYGASNTGSSIMYHGLVREGSGDPNPGNFYLFKNLSTNPTGNVINYSNATRANLVANLTGGIVSGLTQAIAVGDGGTGQQSIAGGQIVIGNGTGALQTIANVTPISSTLNSNYTVSNITTNLYGQVTGFTTQQISGLTVSQGGTGTTTSTGTGAVVLNTNPSFLGTANFTTINVEALYVGSATYPATGVLGFAGSSANSYEQFIIQNANNGTLASADFIVSNDLASDSGFYGDFGMNSSHFSGSGSLSLPNAVYLYSANSDLSIGTAAANAIHFVVNSGTTDAMTISSTGVVSLATALGVASGGTGNTSFITNGIVYGGSSLSSTLSAGTSDQTWSNQILTVTNAGVPVWASAMDGGTF